MGGFAFLQQRPDGAFRLTVQHPGSRASTVACRTRAFGSLEAVSPG